MEEPGKTGRKESFMNAKDKEKLKLAGTIVSFMNSDPIIIDPEEFRKRADIKNKEFYEVERDAKADGVKTKQLNIYFNFSDKVKVAGERSTSTNWCDRKSIQIRNELQPVRCAQ